MNNLVTVANTSLLLVEHEGQRVITLAMMDQVHRRPEGTARRNFNSNKERLTEGGDYFVRNSSEAAAMGFIAPNGLILLTESGYLLLVKSFTDDLAWRVQKQLIKGYFRSKEERQSSHLLPNQLAVVTLEADLKAASLLNVPLHYAQIEAVKAVRVATGVDYSNLLTYAPAQNNIKEEEIMLEPTELGKRYGISARKVNNILADCGYQFKDVEGWVPTYVGKKYCSKHSWSRGAKSGYNLKWHVEKIRPVISQSLVS